MIRTLFAIILSGIFSWCHSQDFLEKLNIPAKHQQVILVTTNTWNDSTGALQLFARAGEKWNTTSHPVTVAVGRNGLAWGQGLHVPKSPEKKEGDGKAPAGIFELAGAFGYEQEPPQQASFPYRQATVRDYWVDDPNSPDYNTWVSIPEGETNDPKQQWDSFERMRREDGLYEVGVIVKHNTEPVAKGKGSAIFMHVWRGEKMPTAGCTAMPKKELVNIMKWLDPQKEPLLIQVPVTELKHLKFRE